jgi:hypothetical protein
METQIKSGNSGDVAKVDMNKRLHTQSLSEDESLHAAELGAAFNLNTGLNSYSADGTLAYLSNTDPTGRDLVVQTLIVGIGDGFTHTDFPVLTLVDTPSGGDLITDASVTGVLNANRNNGKSAALDGLFYKGKVAGTQTGGIDAAKFYLNKTGRTVFPVDWVIGKGKSIALTLDLTISGGSANVYIAIVCYYKDLQSQD